VAKTEAKNALFGNLNVVAMFDIGLYDQGISYYRSNLDAFEVIAQIGGLMFICLAIGKILHFCLVGSYLVKINQVESYLESRGDYEKFTCCFRVSMYFRSFGFACCICE